MDGNWKSDVSTSGRRELLDEITGDVTRGLGLGTALFVEGFCHVRLLS